MKTRTLSLLLCALLMSSSTTVSAASPIKQNSKCTKLNQKVTSLQVKFQCVKSDNKLVWKKIVAVATIESVVPGIKPDFSVEFVDGKVWARLNIPSPEYLATNKISSVEAIIYANKNSTYFKIGTLQYDFKNWNLKSGTGVNFNWDLILVSPPLEKSIFLFQSIKTASPNDVACFMMTTESSFTVPQ